MILCQTVEWNGIEFFVEFDTANESVALSGKVVDLDELEDWLDIAIEEGADDE